jgi:hypothetical protein
MIFRSRSLVGAAMCLLALIVFLLIHTIFDTPSFMGRPQVAVTQLTTHIDLFKFNDSVTFANLKDIEDLASKKSRITDCVHRSLYKCSASKSYVSTQKQEHRTSIR